MFLQWRWKLRQYRLNKWSGYVIPIALVVHNTASVSAHWLKGPECMLAACWVFLYCNTMPTFARFTCVFFLRRQTRRRMDWQSPNRCFMLSTMDLASLTLACCPITYIMIHTSCCDHHIRLLYLVWLAHLFPSVCTLPHLVTCVAGKSLWELFLEQFDELLVKILLLAAFISFVSTSQHCCKGLFCAVVSILWIKFSPIPLPPHWNPTPPRWS